MHDLVLYHKLRCPYCQKVRDFMERKGINIDLRDITESSEILDELISTGGKNQVPCLMIDGKAMYESDDIIKWLDNHFLKELK